MRKEEIKPFLFTDDTIVNVENTKDSTKILEFVCNFSKVAESKVNIPKSIAFLYLNYISTKLLFRKASYSIIRAI